PATPAIPANFAVCEGDAIVLTTTTQAAGYNWTGPNGFQSNQQSPSVVLNASLVDSGRYTLFIIDNNGCQSADTSVLVQVNPTPTTPIVTNNNSPICAGDDLILIANNAALGSTYTWYLANGLPVGTGQTLTLTGATANQAGDYYVTVALNGCESPASAMTTAIIDTIPAVTAFAGADQGLCDSFATTLAATVATGAQGMWTTTSGATIANPMATNSAVYNLPIGTSTFFWTLSSGACSDFSVDSMQIDVTPISTDTANAGLDQNICGQNTATLIANTPITATGRWIQSSSQAGQGIVITNPSNSTTTVTGLQQGQSYNFTWVLSNSNCGDYSSDMVQINVDIAPPDNAYAGTDILLCNQNSTNLAAFASQYGTGFWTSTSSATIIDPTLANTLVINLPQDTSIFVWTLSNGTCQDYSTDTVLVVVSTTNDTADAGLNQVVCSVNALTLAAVTPAAGTGQWSQTAAQAAQGVVIVTPNDPNTQVVGLSAGTTYAFTWTLSNGTCVDYSSDITTITVNATPPDNAFAGNDINLCGASTSSNLAATVPTVATGFWTTTSTATISNPTQPNSTVSGLSNGANVFVWTLSSGSCIDYDSDTVVITVTAPSSDIADAGLDSAYCNQSTITLNAVAPSVGVGYWSQTPSQASLGAVINNPTNPNSAVSNLTAGITYTFTWTLTNGGCVDYSSDQTLITIDILPSNVAYAGEDTVLCGGNATQLDALVPPIGTGFWTTNDSATITTPTDAQSLVVNINQDTTTYYWTLSNGACVGYSVDSVQVVLSPLSNDIAFAGFDAVLCGVDSIILDAAVPTTSTGVWTQSAGQLSQGVVITDPTNPNSSVTGIVSGQVYTFTWTLSTIGCVNFSIDDVVYTINALPPELAYAGPDIILCSGNSTVMDANNPIFSTGQWSSNSSSAVIINPTLNNSTIVNLPVDTIEFYWSLSNGSCLDYSVDTMLVIVTATTSVDTANAGLDIAICNADTAQLMAIAPTVAAGRWIQSNSQASAGVIIDDLTAHITLVRGLQLDSTYTFTWSLSNGPCLDYDTDDVQVQVSSLPTDAAYAGEDFVICGIDTAIVTATTPSVGTGLWTTTSGSIIVTPPSTRTELVNLGLGANAFIWTLSNGACTDYSRDTIIITTDDAPVANADSFVLIYNSTGNTIDVLPNDQLNNNWNISITQDIGSGRLTNLGNGTFDILLQDVLVDQQFIYQLCNPNCPAIFCDTALVLLDVQGGTECIFPNTMTPNNDGVNDAFIVPCLDGLEGTKLTVFNRWGDLLYQNDNYENNWDATHNGAPVPDATYFYIMELADGRKFQGFIEVRR
ncbi:MAG: gliding motility-associated C-terminal domain-containing protein, partial [Aureispira sp.]